MTTIVAPLGDGERRDWVRLARSDGVGPRTFLGLIQRFGTVAAVIEAFPSLARRRAGLRLADPALVDRELALIGKREYRCVALCEPDYPPALRVIDSAPPIIMLRGTGDILQRPAVAIVGSRNASASGAIFAERLAGQLGEAGFAVVSGLARGIDGRAHAGSLRTGTVAVLAGGLDRIYPPEHVKLADGIAETGVLVSEMPLEWEPRSRDFPRRNRLVSGLALGTVVIEAARQSGSLITARFANEQGREVFAVPGSPLDPRAEGTNDLLRQGATLCAHADDVIGALRAAALPQDRSMRSPTSWRDADDVFAHEPDLFDGQANAVDNGHAAENETGSGTVLALLGPAPVSFDDLARLTGQSAAALRAILLDLEIEGQVTRHPGNLVSRSVANP